MTFYPNDRIALFIDGANLYSAAKGLNFDIDYKKLLDEFRRKGVLVRAYYYTALVEGDDYSPIRPLVDWLDYNGYRVVTKIAREFTDATGRRKAKDNIGVELAVDALQIAAHVDHLALFSGDGSLRPLVAALQRRGVHVTVVSTLAGDSPIVSDELRRQADAFVDLATLQPSIAREAPAPAPRLEIVRLRRRNGAA